MELSLLENLSPYSKVDYMEVIEKVQTHDMIKILNIVRVSKFDFAHCSCK
jgi:hypothetical protein